MVEPSVKEKHERFIHGQGKDVSEIVRDLIPANEDMENMKYPAADLEVRGVLAGVVRTVVNYCLQCAG